MKPKTYKHIKLVLTTLLAGSLGMAISLGNVLMALFGLIVFMLIISLLKTRVEGVMVDERQLSVAGKAAQMAFQILMPILLLTSFTLVIVTRRSEFYYLQALGTVLAYVTCLGLSIYAVTYWYFDRKTGGALDD